MSISTIAHVDAMVQRVRSYVSPTTGETAARLCASRIYNGHGGKFLDPETAAFPHAVLRKINVRSDPLTYERENFDVEVMVHHQGRNNGAALETLTDLILQALITWRESSTEVGLSFAREYVQDRLTTVAATGTLANVLTNRLLIAVSSFPRRITMAVA